MARQNRYWKQMVLIYLCYRPRDVTDTLNAYIIDQDPKRYNEEGEPLKIRSGQFINVKLSTEKPVIADSTINNQPLQ